MTGASRGLGAAIVSAALATGDNVVATARNANHIADEDRATDRLLRLSLDVTEEGVAKAAVSNAIARFGRIDVLVNNAGYGQVGAFEENSAEDVAQQFAVNVFGTFHVTRAALPAMRHQRSGRIFNISSIAGLRGGLYSTIYSASKFAVEGFSEALTHELASFGIMVTIVEPGAFRTDFFDPSSIRVGSVEIKDYAELTRKVARGFHKHNHRQVGDPARLAAVLVHMAHTNAPPQRLVLGSDAFAVAVEKVAQLNADINAWRDTSLSTDFPPESETIVPQSD